MHTTQRGLCIWLFAGLLTGGTSAASAPEVKEALDVVYATANGEDLKLDLYTPANLKDPAPLIIYIHGGGWMGGNKAVGRVIASAMAAQGYVSATVGYRLAPKARFPAQVQDVRNAVRFFRANATKYGIDSQRVGAFGHSAGGHLSLMLGLMDPADKLAGEEPLNAESSQVQAVVNFVGPTDLTRTNWTPALRLF